MGKKKKKVVTGSKPTVTVSGLVAPVKGVSGSNALVSTSWTYPKAAFDSKSKSAFSGVLVKWVVDLDSASSKANSVKKTTASTTTTGKGRKKKTITTKTTVTTGNVTGTAWRSESVQKKSGSSATSASLTINRSKYYPCGSAKTTMVKLYKVSAAVYKGNKWVLTFERSGQMRLDELNAKEKAGSIKSAAALQSLAKANNPKGKTCYKAKTGGAETYSETVPGPYVYGAGVLVQGWNAKTAKDSKGNQVWDGGVASVATYRAFNTPDVPVVSHTVAGEASAHTITFTVTADKDDGTSYRERYDSSYTLTKTTCFLESDKLKTDSGTVSTGNKTQKEFTVARDPNQDMPSGRTLLSLVPNEYIKYNLAVRNRGFAGDSANASDKVTFTYACPDDVSVVSVTEKGAQYHVVFKKATPGDNVRYTTKYTLQRLSNYRPSGSGNDRPVDDWDDAQWADAAANESSWTDVYSIGSSELKSGAGSVLYGTFADLISNAYAEPFKRTYYRVVAENDIYGMPGMQSKPFAVPGFLKIPSSANQEMDILSLSSTQDGKAIMAVVGFNKTKTEQGYYNSNGTEMSWDTVDYAWSSTTPPSSYDFMDDTIPPILVTSERKADATIGPYIKDVDLGWVYATYYLRGVNSSEKYYVKGRRFLKDTETRESDSYGPYASYGTSDGSGGEVLDTIEVKAHPKDVKLFVPERLVYGKDLAVSWTYDSDDLQTEYELMWLRGTGDNAKSVAEILRGEKESSPYCVIKWDQLDGKIFEDNIYLSVKMCVDGNWSELSEVKTVRVVSPPRASLSPVTTLTNQPLTMTLGASTPDASAIVRIVSNQLSGWGPTGLDRQADGAIIHTNKILQPSWQQTTLGDGTIWYYYNYSVPTCDLKDHGSYRIEYTASLDEVDLDSDTVDDEGNIVKQTTEFSVSYDETVEVPDFYIVSDPVDLEHGGYARICIRDVSGNSGCVADIYRVTPDGAYPLKTGIEQWRNATIVDKYPPYSRHEPCTYRLAIRSRNGVREWDDRSYSMPGYCVRFDWGDESSEANGVYTHLTLPYNLKWSDSWTKNSRVELHLDGTYTGYWRGGVDHKNSLSTDLVKLTGAEQVARVRALANYAGPVMVRLPNGCAFCADVNVNNMDVSYDSLVITASFSAQEIRMPSAYSNEAATVVDGLYVPNV